MALNLAEGSEKHTEPYIKHSATKAFFNNQEEAVRILGIGNHHAAVTCYNKSYKDVCSATLWDVYMYNMGFVSIIEDTYCLVVHKCSTDVIQYQYVVYCIVFHHAHNISSWCLFFLIGASLLAICGCWWSTGTWLSSLQAYAEENRFGR